jgi:hypothetical protein
MYSISGDLMDSVSITLNKPWWEVKEQEEGNSIENVSHLRDNSRNSGNVRIAAGFNTLRAYRALVSSKSPHL